MLSSCVTTLKTQTTTQEMVCHELFHKNSDVARRRGGHLIRDWDAMRYTRMILLVFDFDPAFFFLVAHLEYSRKEKA